MHFPTIIADFDASLHNCGRTTYKKERGQLLENSFLFFRRHCLQVLGLKFSMNLKVIFGSSVRRSAPHHVALARLGRSARSASPRPAPPPPPLSPVPCRSLASSRFPPAGKLGLHLVIKQSRQGVRLFSQGEMIRRQGSENKHLQTWFGVRYFQNYYHIPPSFLYEDAVCVLYTDSCKTKRDS